MNKNYKIAACIVIFYPNVDRLKKNIEAIKDQVDNVLLVLNSEKNAVENLIEQYDRIVLLGNERNEGVAQAINYAIEYCYSEGIDWLLTLDQDSICPENFVRRYIDSVSYGVGIITCAVNYNGKMTKTEKEPELVKECIQSGAFMNVEIAYSLGGMDSKMFIDQVDFEYCYRLRQAGYRIIQLNDLILDHSLGELDIRRIGPISFYIGNHSAFRKYYIARNVMYCNLIHPEWRSRIFCYKKIIGLFIKVILFEKDKWRKIKAIIQGIGDAPKMVCKTSGNCEDN